MRIVLDTNVLIQLLSKNDEAKIYCPATGALVDRPSSRAAALVEKIDAKSGTVVIPAPVLAEYLVGIAPEAIQGQLEVINGVTCFEIASFDQMAAIECAIMVDEAEHKQLDPDATKAKLKVDRQILAICRAIGATQVWTHDVGLYKKAESLGLDVKSLVDCSPKPVQLELTASE